ncbi:MAG: DUF551 domain-containing protein [Clostridia bacterium]|nr:DUF551 domain-containing protein [Clostridia bacterium]
MSKTKTLIDAEAWLDQCNKSYMHYNLAKKIIAAAPRVEVPCWVDAAEELPDTDQFVLGIVNGKYENITFQNAIQLVEYDGKCWYLDGYPQIDAVNVTHWMPLPMGPGKEIRTVEDACPYKEGKKPNVCKCRSCGAEIVWVTMQSGAKMPCDAALIRCREDKSAKTSFVTPNGFVRCGVEAPDGVADFWGYRSHFESCPQGTFASAAGGRRSEQKGCGLLFGTADNCNACHRQALRASQEGEGTKATDARCGNGNREDQFRRRGVTV